MTTPSEPRPDDITTLKAALLAERAARAAAETEAAAARARAAASEAVVAHLKLMIAKYRREQYGPSSERGRRILDQLELQLEDGTSRREHWDGVGDSTRIAWHGPSALVAAVVDPDDRVLVDANPENNRGATPEGRRRAPRVLERAAYWAELALQMGAP